MDFKRLSYSENDGLVRVSLNRPDKLNAFDMDMFRDIAKLMSFLKRNKSIRVVIVTGEGKDFSSGLDIKSIMSSPTNVLKLLWKWWPTQANLAQKMSVGWRQLPVPVIMAIHGRCWGAGMQLALGGDFRIASPDSSLAIMESRWGLIPDMGGSIALREVVPYDQALDWSITSREISADEANQAGLISRVSDDPIETAVKMAHAIMKKSPDTAAAIKKLYQFAWHHNDSSLLSRECWYQWRMLLGKNRKIAVQRALGHENDRYLPRGF